MFQEDAGHGRRAANFRLRPRWTVAAGSKATYFTEESQDGHPGGAPWKRGAMKSVGESTSRKFEEAGAQVGLQWVAGHYSNRSQTKLHDEIAVYGLAVRMPPGSSCATNLISFVQRQMGIRRC